MLCVTVFIIVSYYLVVKTGDVETLFMVANFDALTGFVFF